MSSSSSGVGIIGVGAMGFALLQLLLDAGFAVSAFDPSPTAREQASTVGATCLPDAKAVFTMDAPVITCLPNTQAFLSTIEEAISAGRRTKPVIETSTLDPSVKEGARRRLLETGAELLDCPLSGTSAQARNRDLVVFASGSPTGLASCKAIFTAIARTTIQAGDFGMGMRLKLLANHLVGIHTAAAAEVLMLARKVELDPIVALQALTASAGSSRMLEVRGKLMAEHKYLPATGNIDIIIKDGGMITDLAQQTGCTLPLFSRALELFQCALATGLGNHDMAALHEYLLENPGTLT
ncbi:hypothetical protein H2200_012446 [Cladophialophora chaetospira]|uniref:NAD(P)-dependent oxidoreductase n=1 Tax=Cladophialophora chaetospira TaxID=386627 RepID=A0AA38WXX6_9EURO|nr:hypothetical protein H2200_012446 [Cladophialophora chaetospira]